MPTDLEWHNSELDRKWAYWGSITRMDMISQYIRNHCEEPGGGLWKIEESIFRAGVGLEALHMARISAWACLRGVPTHPEVSRLYQRLLAGSEGMYTIDELLFSRAELEQCQYDCGLTSATDVMDMKDKSKDFDKVFKAPPRWWMMMDPEHPDDGAKPFQMIDDFLALRRVRGKPEALNGVDEDDARAVQQVLEDATQVLQALRIDHEDQLQYLNKILAMDERELLELYVAAYPDGALTADQRDTRDGFGLVGENVMQAVLASVPHTT
ncbi:unnamed protein product [Peniophora sp. CBMAI 1063]|nr:unnamed protein product [Peniophora sp. CBMAI 1063]